MIWWISAIALVGALTMVLLGALASPAVSGALPDALPGAGSDAGVVFAPPTSSAGAIDGGSTATAAPEEPPSEPLAAETEQPAASGAALDLLATLPIKGRAPKTGYDRVGEFGRAWLDTDKNGCDTRNDILARDLVAIERPGGCRVLTGLLIDPYTGTAIDFVRGQGTSQVVQIDHVVALSNAWQTGAQTLSFEQRVALANDPLNLLAVDGRTNQQKGDGDAATWLPPNKAFRCEFVARQVSVKAAHGLWVTPPEHAAIVRVLEGCPGQMALVG